jgi:hypothetical protein
MFSFPSNDGDEVDGAVGDAVKVGAAVSVGLPMISRTVTCYVNTPIVKTSKGEGIIKSRRLGLTGAVDGTGKAERLDGKDDVGIVGATLAPLVAEGRRVGGEVGGEGLIVDGISVS